MAEGQHEDKSDRDGHKEDYDHSKTKDVNESSGGKHGKDGRGDK